MPTTLPFKAIRLKHVPLVGGKTASLGELMSIGMPVPDGFAVTAEAYRRFIRENKLEKKIRSVLKSTDVSSIRSLSSSGKKIRSMIRAAEFPEEMKKDITASYRRLKSKHVAVRSSATAEDLPDSSFAGQQESYLNVTEKNLFPRIRDCFASLFTDRAISYRKDRHYDHFKIYLSVAVQKQVFSKSSGVMFTLDPDSGHRNFIVINSSFGLGDFVVQGRITPDEFLIFKKTCKTISMKLGRKTVMETRTGSGVKYSKVDMKTQCKFSLTKQQAEQLALYGKAIEKHYKKPMDIEWAIDKDIYIIQARPETIQSQKKENIYTEYKILQKSKILASGVSIGRKISSGKAIIIPNVKNIGRFRDGCILVTKETDPDWEPIMKKASGIVTEEGGRTSHAAIVSRELGIPAIVGCRDATKKIRMNQAITVDCSGESGKIWSGLLRFKETSHRITNAKTKVGIYVNIGEPEKAPDISLMPVDGVGLAREEFIISSEVKMHPLAAKQQDYISKLSGGIGKIAASFWPRPVVIRFSDFKTNEYRTLEGGDKFEPFEENPMIGWRGASRYIDPEFEDVFRLECRAVKKCIDNGMDNIKVMVPFCRTLDEGKRVVKIIRSEGLKCHVGVMAEIPSNIILAGKFAKIFDFFSIGSNDLTQLILGVDRDSERLARTFDERNEAVKIMIRELIRKAKKSGTEVGICGQAPSDYPEMAKLLAKWGISYISVNPDSVMVTRKILTK